MSKTQQVFQVQAHPTHWYDWILNVIIPAIAAGNTVLANSSLISAPIEAGIQFAMVTAATAAASSKAVEDPVTSDLTPAAIAPTVAAGAPVVVVPPVAPVPPNTIFPSAP